MCSKLYIVNIWKTINILVHTLSHIFRVLRAVFAEVLHQTGSVQGVVWAPKSMTLCIGVPVVLGERCKHSVKSVLKRRRNVLASFYNSKNSPFSFKMEFLYKVGLTQASAVLGKRTKWSELYTPYIERHFVKFDNEMRPIFVSRRRYLRVRMVLVPLGIK
ncbi:MAG: hypothetical protein UV60_C0003G0031 [Parcubacteria group bacterium GW2011_GWA2_43_11]|nr:MAG: hypothetical protein UU89_C0018G0008 [Parcubacteria group bacterium GW2011_GWC2_42_11]KKS86113.1 MAG: hypothetical protein UV60_C0003G0031 [Parcubacteria group bacterium GW2011_GWA2_43_11]